MSDRYSEQAGARFIFLLLSLLILLACSFYIKYEYDNNIYPDKLAHDAFNNIPCRIIDKKLSVNVDSVSRYRADFLISYQINDAQYNRWVSGNGFDLSFKRNKASQEGILDKYNIGENYSCYLDPNDPQIALLTLRYNWFSTLPLLIPVAIGLMALLYLIQNIVIFSRKKS